MMLKLLEFIIGTYVWILVGEIYDEPKGNLIAFQVIEKPPLVAAKLSPIIG